MKITRSSIILAILMLLALPITEASAKNSSKNAAAFFDEFLAEASVIGRANSIKMARMIEERVIFMLFSWCV